MMLNEHNLVKICFGHGVFNHDRSMCLLKLVWLKHSWPCGTLWHPVAPCGTLWHPVAPCGRWLWNSWVKLSCELPEFPTAESTHQPLKRSGHYAGVPNRLCFWWPFFSQHICQFQDTNTESKWKELTAEPIKADAFLEIGFPPLCPVISCK